jgi:adenylate cyclase
LDPQTNTPATTIPDSTTTNAAPAAIATPPTAPPTPAPATETSTPAPAATPTPATTPPATETTTAPAPQSESEDEQFLDGAALFPQMVTAAALNDGGQNKLKDDELLPTRPLKNVTGDINALMSNTAALVPFPALRKESYFGFVDQEAQSGGGGRRTIPLVVNYDGHPYPSFDLQTLLQYWDIDPDKVTVALGHEITLPHPDGTISHIPIDSTGLLTINYRDRVGDFQGESYASMGAGMSDQAEGKTSLDRDHLPVIKDNIVVIGITFIGTDAGPNPLNAVAPLVVTHLNALNNILQQDFVTPISAWIWAPAYLLFIFVAGNLMLRVGIAPMIPMGILALVVVAATGFILLWTANLQVPVFMPEIGILLLAGAVPTKRFFGEEREKIRVKNAMRSYLSDKVMTKILAHPDNVKLGGTKQVITIMFCDIRGFTKYCDNRDSEEVLTVLNEYMEEMTQVVFKYDGTVDKYIGDCIMAFWNAPDLQPDHAQRAVCCAMEMRYALANFKTKRAGKDTELFECGIGIHTGEALVGNMGSSLKLNYTAMGSTVNMGARLETLTKRLNERILISQDTLDLLQGDFPITDRGEATVPGFAQPIHVYAVGADQDIKSALSVGRTLAGQQEYTAEEVQAPMWKPAPLPEDADPNP